ncbi:hypothetical protein Dsin_032205, partial [Dipteronia sinensis]
MENVVVGDNQKNISKNLRHLMYNSDDQLDGIKKFEAFYGVKNLSNLTYNGGLYDGVKIFEAFNDLRHLRTFLPLMLPLPWYDHYDCDIEIDGFKQVEHRNTIGLSSLKPLVFSDIASHVFLIEQFTQRLSQVEDVKIVGYKEATSFVKDDFVSLAKLPQALHNFSFLRSICIANCPGLVSFPEAGLPSQLKSI